MRMMIVALHIRTMIKVDKASYDNSWYKPGSYPKRVLWHFAGAIFIKSALIPFSSIKVRVLRLFGAEVGDHVTIKPGVTIKYPWKLKVGSYVGIGENVWIDNLDFIDIGDQVTISQGALLLTGSHDLGKSSFDLLLKPISIEDGVWITAKSIVCQGVTCGSHSVLGIGSIATSNMEPYYVYSGSPAKKKQKRVMN